jgi:protein Mpv17
MSLIWAKYTAALSRRPILTKVFTAGTLMFIGDFLAQKLDKKPFDLKRDAVLTTYASAMTPIVHYWYNFVEKSFPGGSMRNAFKKVACDQLLFAPIGMGLFLTVTTLMEGKSFEEAKQKLKKDYVRGMKANYTVWPAVNFINFKYVPLEQRILFSAVVSLGWNVYIATLKHS